MKPQKKTVKPMSKTLPKVEKKEEPKKEEFTVTEKSTQVGDVKKLKNTTTIADLIKK